MMLSEQIYAQALILADALDHRQEELLRILCASAEKSMSSRLRDGITPQDCSGDFIAASSLYALAALSETVGANQPESFQAGDVTVHRGKNTAAANCLRRQADLMMAPYLLDQFSFSRV